MSDPPKFFFVHVMKTGGTSLVFHLLREFPSDAVYPSALLDRRHPSDAEPYLSIADLTALTPARRAEIRMYAGHLPFMVRDLIDGDVTTLTLLRHPIDRTVSVLKHFKRLHARYRELELDEIYEDAFLYRHFVENHQTKVFSVNVEDGPRMVASTITFQDLHAYLAGAATATSGYDTITIDARRLAKAKANLALVDVVGVSDRFGAFVEALQDRFGWWPSGLAGNARANVSSEPWEASAALRARIARDNAFDVELYEYARELAP
jgi:hypothetical protein